MYPARPREESMPLKLMTVDDSATIRRIVGGFARELAPDAEVIEAENGCACLEKIARGKPDLIVLDINMPVMNGIECLEQLKGNPATADIPVVMLTTESEKALVLRLVKMGIAQYIIKPFEREEFFDKVGGVLERRPAAAAARAEPPVPTGEYLLVLQEREKAIELIRGACRDRLAIVTVAAATEAMSCFEAKAPRLVIANLHGAGHEALDLFARMRRIPERQHVRYIGTCLRTAEDLISRARASGYVELLLKPFAERDVSRILQACAPPRLRTGVNGDVYVIHAAAVPFAGQAATLTATIDRAAEEGFCKLLIDVTPIPEDDQRQPAMWEALREHLGNLGLRAVCVTRLVDVGETLAGQGDGPIVRIVDAVEKGISALAA
jgi:two-component system chemotaxis response regulator CheY